MLSVFWAEDVWYFICYVFFAQTFSPTAGLYDSRDVYYTSAQADTLTPLVQQQHQQQQQQQQHATVEGRSGTSHQQLNIQTSLLSSADDRQGEWAISYSLKIKFSELKNALEKFVCYFAVYIVL